MNLGSVRQDPNGKAIPGLRDMMPGTGSSGMGGREMMELLHPFDWTRVFIQPWTSDFETSIWIVAAGFPSSASHGVDGRRDQPQRSIPAWRGHSECELACGTMD
jgi:hypothetical protein